MLHLHGMEAPLVLFYLCCIAVYSKLTCHDRIFPHAFAIIDQVRKELVSLKIQDLLSKLGERYSASPNGSLPQVRFTASCRVAAAGHRWSDSPGTLICKSLKNFTHAR